MAGCRCLTDTVGAGAAGVFRAHGHDHAQLGRHNVQPLRAIFADLAHDATAARADQAGGSDDFFDAGECCGKVADGALARQGWRKDRGQMIWACLIFIKNTQYKHAKSIR